MSEVPAAIKRFDKLLSVIDRGLEENQSSIDTHVAVAVGYGDDVSMFDDVYDTSEVQEEGCDKNSRKNQNDNTIAMLANLIDGVLEQANDKIRAEVRALLARERIEERLSLLDQILEDYDSERNQALDAEVQDRLSAQEQSKRARLPDGTSVIDLLSLQAYNIKLRAYEELTQELQSIENENAILVQEIQEKKELITERIISVEQQGKILENAADLCSLDNAL